MDPAWFGKLPESSRLAERYDAHREAEAAGLDNLPGLLGAIADALDASAAVYVCVDEGLADLISAA